MSCITSCVKTFPKIKSVVLTRACSGALARRSRDSGISVLFQPCTSSINYPFAKSSVSRDEGERNAREELTMW